MSPGFKIAPTDFDAEINGVKSGWLASLIGVGTATIWKSAFSKSLLLLVNSIFVCSRSIVLTSSVLSILSLSSSMRLLLISKPITD